MTEVSCVAPAWASRTGASRMRLLELGHVSPEMCPSLSLSRSPQLCLRTSTARSCSWTTSELPVWGKTSPLNPPPSSSRSARARCHISSTQHLARTHAQRCTSWAEVGDLSQKLLLVLALLYHWQKINSIAFNLWCGSEKSLLDLSMVVQAP